MLRQSLEQKLLQKLSPQQIQLMKLLQIPTSALEQRIKQEIEENPTLELLEDNQDDNNHDEDSNVDDFENDNSEEKIEDEFDISDYIDDDIPDYRLNSQYSKDEDKKTMPFASSAGSFRDMLLEQLVLQDITQKQLIIGEHIIGNIDDTGYLQRNSESLADDISFFQNISVEVKDILKVIEIIHKLDPPGVGAQSLQECLLIQLERKKNIPFLSLAKLLIKDFFNEFSKKHYDKILKKLKITENELKEAISIILKLNPKPGASFSDTERAGIYIVPDFIISNENGELELTVNSRNLPDLRINNLYMKMVQDLPKSAKMSEQQKQTVQFVKQKVESAKWFIDALRQRQNTLYVTMKAIMDYQNDYFSTGDETKIKPMILKDISEIVNLDISTISRVANSKYVQTSFGTFLIKSFFSESLTTDAGEEVSSREVKKIMMDAIENEDKKKPVTDEKLMNILKDKGYNIARRTVAKYREVLGIPVARLRKEI